MPAGTYIWAFGRFDVYRVNPPLVRAMAALPAVLCDPVLSWRGYMRGFTQRPEWSLGDEFVAANDAGDLGWLDYFMMGRWACAPFSVLAGFVVWRWSAELYGRASGLLALTLWCTCPNVLAWASTICPDAPAASMGAAASYLFWRWLRRPSWPRALGTGFVLGLAELAKTTWIVFYALWPIVWLGWRVSDSRFSLRERALLRGAKGGSGEPSPSLGMLAAMVLLSVYVVNLGYGFEGSGKRLGDFTFVSKTLGGSAESGNRFRGTWLGELPMPMPENYLSGIDLQKADFEAGKDSYLCGEWKHGGWWYYYLFVAVLKVPLGTWGLGFLALGLTIAHCRERAGGTAEREFPTAARPHPGLLPQGDGVPEAARPHPNSTPAGYSAGWRNEITLLLPALAVLVLVSSQTGFSRYFRYVLPAFPFAYIWISKVASSIPLGQRPVALAVAALVSWSVTSSAMVYPHSMSYFNELAGGPLGGHRYVIDANIDWGQDMVYLSEWLDKHPEATPLKMAYLSFIKPRHFGIESTTPPEGPMAGASYAPDDEKLDQLGPRPGWYAMSIHRTHSNTQRFLYFLDFKPVAHAGYSISIYHITLDEANRARRRLGLPPVRENTAGASP